jgi:hypothetical protein
LGFIAIVAAATGASLGEAASSKLTWAPAGGGAAGKMSFSLGAGTAVLAHDTRASDSRRKETRLRNKDFLDFISTSRFFG